MRKSREEQLAGVPIIPATRLEPPDDLDPEQQGIWRGIVERMPQDWVTAENAALLVELCRHVSYARQLAARIDAVRATLAGVSVADAGGSETEAKEWRRFTGLLNAHGYQSERIGNLATKLRLTNQSRYQPTQASERRNKAPAGTKPWGDWRDDRNNRPQ